ncbi:MAG TPA: hypothetical protein VIL57_00955, partial [Bacteroidia bacterium]
MINQDNYILWFIDYADNKLNEEEKNTLRKFLLNNPTLQNEFLDYLEASKLVIEADDATFLTDLQSLKKVDNDQVVSENSQIDIRTLFEYSEGNLNFEQTIELEQEIQNNPELSKTLQLLEASKIPADYIEYPHKNELKKRVVVPFFIWGNVVKYGSVAASLAMVFWLGSNWNNSQGETLIVQQGPSKSDLQKAFAYFEQVSNERAIALAKELQLQNPTEVNNPTKIIYVNNDKANSTNQNIDKNTTQLAQNIYIPTPVINSPNPNMEQPANYLASSTISNPQLDAGKFTPIRPEQNISPFDFQLANSDKKKPKFMDILSTIVTLGGVLDKKDTKMVTSKPDEKGNKKVHFYSKAFEAEFAVKE